MADPKDVGALGAGPFSAKPSERTAPKGPAAVAPPLELPSKFDLFPGHARAQYGRPMYNLGGGVAAMGPKLSNQEVWRQTRAAAIPAVAQPPAVQAAPVAPAPETAKVPPAPAVPQAPAVSPEEAMAGNQRYLARIASQKAALPFGGQEERPMTYIEALGQAFKMMPEAGSFASALMIPKWANQIAGNQMASIRGIEADKRKQRALELSSEKTGAEIDSLRAAQEKEAAQTQAIRDALGDDPEARERALAWRQPNAMSAIEKVYMKDIENLRKQLENPLLDEVAKAGITAQIAQREAALMNKNNGALIEEG